MSDPLSPSEKAAQILALADAELDPQAAARLRDACAGDPVCLEAQLAHQRALKQACARCLEDPGACPPDLKVMLAAMCSQGSGAEPRKVGVLRRIGAWLPMAVAALIAIAAGGWFTAYMTGGGIGMDDTGQAQLLQVADLTPGQLETFSRRYKGCTRGTEAPLQPERFPQDIQALPGAVEDYFDKPVHGVPLDLSPLGYSYQRAGLCSIPGQTSVLVVYTPAPGSGHTEGLSLWIRPVGPRIQGIEPGRLYSATCGKTGETLLIWRDGDLVYYLVGPSRQATQRVAQTLQPAKPTI